MAGRFLIFPTPLEIAVQWNTLPFFLWLALSLLCRRKTGYLFFSFLFFPFSGEIPLQLLASAIPYFRVLVNYFDAFTASRGCRYGNNETMFFSITSPQR